MNVNKRNNYQLTGSIHTLSLISLPVEYLYRPHHKAIEHIKSYQVQRLTGKWFYLPDVHAIAEYYNTSTYSIYQLLTRSPKEIKGNYEIYESDNIKIKVGKEK